MGDLSTKGREGVTPHQTRFPQTVSSMPLPALGQSIHLASLLLHLTHQLQHLKPFVMHYLFNCFLSSTSAKTTTCAVPGQKKVRKIRRKVRLVRRWIWFLFSFFFFHFSFLYFYYKPSETLRRSTICPPFSFVWCAIHGRAPSIDDNTPALGFSKFHLFENQ